jgi:AcrR family transcriptional regulator
MSDTAVATGRAAQRARTREAIVAAASRLLARGEEPTVAEVAAEADVSRRTVYMYFPTLDQLLLDAAVGALTVEVDTALRSAGTDVHQRIDALVDAMCATAERSLPLGRKLIKLTVDAPTESTPRRGYRRIAWIESAVQPVRKELGAARFNRLVSGLALILGWEAFIVLADVRGLTVAQSREVMRASAHALVDTARAH